MQRYEIQDWIDYVRGLGDETVRRAMRTDLENGEPEAERGFRFAQELRLAVEEGAEGPSPLSSWAAKAIPSIQKGRFDQLPPSPAGVLEGAPRVEPRQGQRQGHVGERKLRYRSGLTELDLWVGDPEEGSTLEVVMGQVLAVDDQDKTAPAQGASVFLVVEDTVAASTQTNQFGEFHLRSPREGRVDLRVVVRGHGSLEFSLQRKGFDSLP